MLWKMRFGSGVKGRNCAGLPFSSDCVIQEGMTTGIMYNRASAYWGKSLVAEMMMVVLSRSILPSVVKSSTSPLCSFKTFLYYRCVSQQQVEVAGATYLLCLLYGKVAIDVESEDILFEESTALGFCHGWYADSVLGCYLDVVIIELCRLRIWWAILQYMEGQRMLPMRFVLF